MDNINRRKFLETTMAIVPAAFCLNSDNKKTIKFSTKILETDIPNKNNRIYPKHVIEKAIEKSKGLIKNRSFMGHLGMPEDAKIHFSMVSHIVTDLKLNDRELIAEIEVLSTPCGKKLQKMLENGSVDLRSSGIGIPKANEDGTFVIEDYELIAINAIEAGTGA